MKNLSLFLAAVIISYGIYLIPNSDRKIDSQLCWSAFNLTIVLEGIDLEPECISFCVKPA